MAKYILPDLRYDYDALEPHVSGRIMELHHDKHHAGYVKAANDTLDQLDEARLKADFTRLAAMERALAFNLSGHILHSLFWQNLTPHGDGRPQGLLGRIHSAGFRGLRRLQAATHEGGLNDHGFWLGCAGVGARGREASHHTNL